MAYALQYKKNFRASAALELFYTGGPVVLSPDASVVACACTEDVKIVEVETGKVRHTLKGDSEVVTSLALTPDGKFLLSASRSLQIRLWDLSSAANLRSWKAHEAPITVMTMDASGGLLATASADRSVMVWDVDGGFCTHAFRGHKGIVSSILFHLDPGRLLLFSGGDDATVRVWDLVRKTCISVLDKHFGIVTSLAVSADGFSLLSAGRDKVVNVWDLQDYTLRTTVPVYEALEAVCVVPDTCNFPGIKVANLNTPGGLTSKKGSGGVLFLTVGELGIIRVWNSNGAVCLYNQKSPDAVISSQKEESKGGILQATLIVPGERVMCVTADQRLLFYESVEGGDLKLSKRLIGYNEEIIDLKFVGEDETQLAVATNLEQVRVYNTESMACVQELVGHTDIVLCLDWCITSSRQSLLASSAKDRTVRLWDLENGICVGVAAGHMAAVGAVAFSKRRKNFFVSGSSDCTLKVWSMDDLDAKDGTLKKLSSQAAVVAHDKDINAVAIAPNDSLVCSASQDRTARVWKLPELVPVVTLTGHKRGVWSVEFSPVDQCIMTASGDKTIRIWALSDGSCLKTFEGHTASVLKVAFITRGTQIVSAGADGLVKLWTIKSNECTNTFDNHEDKIWALAVSAKDERLATGGADSLVNIWVDCTAADQEEAFRQETIAIRLLVCFEHSENEILRTGATAFPPTLSHGASLSYNEAFSTEPWEAVLLKQFEHLNKSLKDEAALKDQDLANALKDVDYVKAVQLGFELKRPLRLLHVFEEVFRSDGAEFQMQLILQALGKEHLHLLLEYARDWNSKSKFCHVAQRVIFSMLHIIPPTGLLKVPGIRELLEGIIPYTERHFGRIDRLSRSTFVLDFILSSMSSVVPSEDGRLLGDVPLASSLKFVPLGTTKVIPSKHTVEDSSLEELKGTRTDDQFEDVEELGGKDDICGTREALSAKPIQQKMKRSLEDVDAQSDIVSDVKYVDSRIKDSKLVPRLEMKKKKRKAKG